MNTTTTEISITPLSIRLTEWQHWPTWYETIKQRAIDLEIWHLVDPDGDTGEPEKLPEPEDPGDRFDLTADLGAKDAQRYDRQAKNYGFKLRRYEQRNKSLLNLKDYIISTLSPVYLNMISSKTTLKEKLAVLKSEIKPSDKLIRADLMAEYNKLKPTPYDQTTNRYLQAWTNLSLRDKMQPKEIRLFTLGEEEPCRALATALEPLYPMYAEFRLAAMNSSLDFSMTNEVVYWKETFNAKEVIKFPAKVRKVALAAESVTLHGQHSRLKPAVTRTAAKTPLRCLCGNNHQWYRCYYLNNDYPRPSGWTMNRIKKAQIQKQLNLKPELQAKIDANIRQWRLTLPSTEQPNKGTNSVVKRQLSDEEESSNGSGNVTLVAISLAGAWSSSDLRHSVILDHGSNVHIVNKQFEHRITTRKPADGIQLQTGAHVYMVSEIVTFVVYPKLAGSITTFTLMNAFYIPEFMTSIISGLLAAKEGIYLDTGEPYMYIRHKSKRLKACGIITGPTQHYIIETLELPAVPSMAVSAAAASKAERKHLKLTDKEWHRVMGHPSAKAISELESNTLGSKVESRDTHNGAIHTSINERCEICLKSKAKAIVSRRSTTNREVSRDSESKKMAVVSWDIIEMLPSLPDASRGNIVSRYLSHYYYDNEGYHVGTSVATKAHAAIIISDHFKLMERIFRAETTMFRSDLEGSLGHKNSQASKVFNKLGILRLPSAADTPAQNGAAEASGNAVITKARCLRADSGLPKELWPWLTEAAIYLLNRTPNQKIEFKTPFEKVTGSKPFIGHLHPIGCKAFVLNRDLDRRDKLEDRAHVGYHLGCAGSTNIYYVYVPKIRKVIRSRDVYFKDNELYSHFDINNLTLGEQITEPIHKSIISRIEISEDDLTDSDLSDPITASKVPIMQINAGSSQGTSQNKQQLQMEPEAAYPTPPATRDPTEDADDPQLQYSDAVEHQSYVAALLEPHTFSLLHRNSAETEIPAEGSMKTLQIHQKDLPSPPIHWQEMLTHKYAIEWQQSANKEMEKLYGHGTFEKVQGYDGYKLKLKWVFSYKLNESGYLLRFKARLCVRGDLQLPSVQETYAATLAYKVFRFMCALICTFDLCTMQFDVVNAFPHAELDKEVYCLMPPGMEEQNTCLLLKRALYGLSESPRLWYNLLVQELEDYGFISVPGVRCLMEGHNMWILFYVDDIILIYWPSDGDKAQRFRNHLSKRFEITYAGEAKWFLGLEIRRDLANKKLWLSQKSYIEKLGTKFNITGRNRYSSVPIPPGTKNISNESQASPSTIKGFQTMVGSIGHAAIATRPDIAKAHTFLAQYLQNPSDRHLELADQTLSYLYGSKEYCLMFDGFKPPIEIYCDASFADNSDRKSSHGLLVVMYGAPVEWKATKQKTITTSTTEAELLALSTIAGHAYWWRRLFEAIDFKLDNSVYQVFCDNERAVNISNCKEEVEETAMRHVDIRQQWIRQETSEGRLRVSWVPTKQQKADGLTKHLSKILLERFRNSIGVHKYTGPPGAQKHL